MTLHARGISLSQNSAPIYSRRFSVRIVINHTFIAATFLVPKQRAYWVQLQTVWVFQPVKFTICFLSTKELEVLVFPLKTLDHVQRTFVQFWLKVRAFHKIATLVAFFYLLRLKLASCNVVAFWFLILAHLFVTSK